MRNTKTSIRERLAFGGMYFPSTHDELAGEFSYVRLANNASPPAAVTGKWHLYVDASGLHIKDPSGTVTDIASDSVQAKTGDWMMSTVTTARTGWTNVSATYSNKFMRINATPLTTGGTNAHTHTGPSHTHSHSATSGTGSTQGAATDTGGGAQYSFDTHTHSVSGTTGAEGTGATSSSDNIPAYVQVVIFQKD